MMPSPAVSPPRRHPRREFPGTKFDARPDSEVDLPGLSFVADLGIAPVLQDAAQELDCEQREGWPGGGRELDRVPWRLARSPAARATPGATLTNRFHSRERYQ